MDVGIFKMDLLKQALTQIEVCQKTNIFKITSIKPIRSQPIALSYEVVHFHPAASREKKKCPEVSTPAPYCNPRQKKKLLII